MFVGPFLDDEILHRLMKSSSPEEILIA